jgi:hypothetical protein
VNVVVEQHVDLYISVFYDMLPQPGWFFTIDGEHPPP